MVVQPTNAAPIATGTAGLYRLCGFTVRSELALPELHRLDRGGLADPADPDLDIRFDSVPERLDGADHVEPRFQTRGASEILIDHPAIGRFRLAASGSVRIQPASPVVEMDLRAVLFGSVLGAFVHMRGLLPLHASAVRFGDGVIAFTGASGAGKSTLAAFLAERGHLTLSDDVCVIDGDRVGAMVRPTLSRLKLWGASMDALGKPRLEAHRDTLRWEKYHLCQEPAVAPLPLRAIVALEKAPADDTCLREITGAAAVTTVLENVFRPEFGRCLGFTPGIFRRSAAVAAAVPIFRLSRPWDLDRIDPVVDLLEQRWGRT